ncbi:ATP-binding cassette domain-containing protein [Aminobacter sp. MSH1]|uniref:branched-chain amino acid ABC transporter ATP-binding protein/permease n=1 Tax=Aminobacter sp. MSH1 TaxID=374606 RepID=UPI000D3488DE|nr:ATP-binding cassette domain-containing protein [Aminobacter sp. MSH1]
MSIDITADAGVAHRWRPRTEIIEIFMAIVAMISWVLLSEMTGNPYWIYTSRIVLILLIPAIFQNFIVVDAGQVSFGQGVMFGVAAYGLAILFGKYEFPLAVAAVGGVALATLAGIVFALPALRVQGYYLGFVTFGAAMVFPELMTAADSITNGVNGIAVYVPGMNTKILGISLLSILILSAAILTLLSHFWIRQTRFGRAMQVMAASPEAAQTLGINPGLMRCAAFVIAAFGTGVAGLLYAPTVGFVGPSAFHLELSMLFFFAVIVGGRGHFAGPLVGLAVLFVLPNMLLADIVNYRLLIYGAIALIIMLVLPNGIVGSFEKMLRQRRRAGESILGLQLDALLYVETNTRGVDPSEIVVKVEGGNKRFGNVVAVDNVDFTVRRGEIHGLIGANGSGKTSLLNVLSGLSRLNSGKLWIFGRDVTDMAPHHISRLGVGRTFQTPRIFEDLSSWDNLRIGADANPVRNVSSALQEQIGRRLSRVPMEFVPHGERRMLEVYRVSLKGADLLLLDEPASGLSASERQNFATLLRQLKSMGKTIVLVEHDLDFVVDVADRLTVMEAGRVAASGHPTEVKKNPVVSSLFEGMAHA